MHAASSTPITRGTAAVRQITSQKKFPDGKHVGVRKERLICALLDACKRIKHPVGLYCPIHSKLRLIRLLRKHELNLCFPNMGSTLEYVSSLSPSVGRNTRTSGDDSTQGHWSWPFAIQLPQRLTFWPTQSFQRTMAYMFSTVTLQQVPKLVLTHLHQLQKLKEN